MPTKAELEELNTQLTNEVALLKAELDAVQARVASEWQPRLNAADGEAERLRAEVARVKAERDVYQAEAKKRAIKEKRDNDPTPKNCINCGQAMHSIEVLENGDFQCPVCRHVWTEADELSPFRRGAR